MSSNIKINFPIFAIDKESRSFNIFETKIRIKEEEKKNLRKALTIKKASGWSSFIEEEYYEYNGLFFQKAYFFSLKQKTEVNQENFSKYQKLIYSKKEPMSLCDIKNPFIFETEIEKSVNIMPYDDLVLNNFLKKEDFKDVFSYYEEKFPHFLSIDNNLYIPTDLPFWRSIVNDGSNPTNINDSVFMSRSSDYDISDNENIILPKMLKMFLYYNKIVKSSDNNFVYRNESIKFHMPYEEIYSNYFFPKEKINILIINMNKIKKNFHKLFLEKDFVKKMRLIEKTIGLLSTTPMIQEKNKLLVYYGIEFNNTIDKYYQMYNEAILQINNWMDIINNNVIENNSLSISDLSVLISPSNKSYDKVSDFIL